MRALDLLVRLAFTCACVVIIFEAVYLLVGTEEGLPVAVLMAVIWYIGTAAATATGDV